MDLLVQQLVIGGAVLVAVGYLVWHYWRRRRKAGCASCAARQALLQRPARGEAERQNRN